MNVNGRVLLGPRFDKLRGRALAAGGVGLLACVAGVFLNPHQFLLSYLWAYLFWLGIALGSLALLMLYHLVNGAWGVVVQRVLEASSRTLPYMALLFIPVLLGTHVLYDWAKPEIVAHDGSIQHKSLYLNVPFVLVRAIFYFAVWIVCARLLNRWSAEQDRTGDPALLPRMRTLSGPGLVLWGLTITFAGIDWVMSLEPHWSSSIYGGFFIVGEALSALAFSILVLRAISQYEPLASLVSVKAFHDLGNLTLAFVVLWAYIVVSQLIIIWSGNLPNEISWYEHRNRGGWEFVAVFLALFHFFLPFGFLLSRKVSMRIRNLARLVACLLVVRMVDLFWLVIPSYRQGQFYLHWLDIAAPIGIGGVWLWLFVGQLASRPLVAVNDPRLAEAFENVGGH
jgi:hypothetical protein